jgi:PPOX class probable F420-dependent enzyme
VNERARDEFVREMLTAPHPCCLTSLDEDGRPYGVVVWCALDGDRFTVNAADGHWLGNLRRDPRVSLVIVDTDNILRHVAVQGTVIEIEPDVGYAHIDLLSRAYEGRPYQYSHPEDVPRYRLAIEPDRIRTLDLEPAAETTR